MSATVSARIYPSKGPVIRAVTKGGAALKAAPPAPSVWDAARASIQNLSTMEAPHV